MLIVCACAWHMFVQVCLSIELSENPCLLPLRHPSKNDNSFEGGAGGPERHTQECIQQGGRRRLFLNFPKPSNRFSSGCKKARTRFQSGPEEERKKARRVFPAQAPSSLVVEAKQAGPGALRLESRPAAPGPGHLPPPTSLKTLQRPREPRQAGEGAEGGGGRQAGASSRS